MEPTHEAVKQGLQRILDRQYADGEERQSRNGDTWGGPGGDVKRAVSYAGDAMRDPSPEETPLAYLQNLIAGIEEQRGNYKYIESDRDGYGSGTFNEILRDANSLLASFRRG